MNNIKFLRRYSNLPEQLLHRQAMMYTLPALGETTPQALFAVTWSDHERRLSALPELWRLIANPSTAAVLLEPLTMATRIWLP